MPGQPARHVGERLQVARTNPVAGTAEQTHEFAAGGGVVHHAQHAHNVGDLGGGEQPTESEHVGTHAVGPQHLGEVFHLAAGPEQHGATAFGLTVLADQPGGEPVGDGAGLLGDGLRHEGVDRAGPGIGGHLERFDLDSARFGAERGAEWGDEGVGRVEHEGGIAPGEGQRHGRGRGCGTEIMREAEQVCAAGAAPSVNGLVRITDGHHRVVAKQGVQQLGLQDRGVLVLVEEHYPVLLAIPVDDGVDLLADLQCQGYLIRELDQSEATLLAAVAGGQLGQYRKRGDRGQGVSDRPVRCLLARITVGQIGQVAETVDQCPEVVGSSGLTKVNGRRILGQGTAELQHGIGDEVEAFAEGHEPPVAEVDDDATGQEPGAGFAQQHRLGFAAEQQGVVGEQAAGEGIVGGHVRGIEQVGRLGGRALVRVGVDGDGDRHEAGRFEVADALVDALTELAGRLAGEGESENLVGASVAVGEQPQHPVGHGLGLAAAGSGDDEGRRERRFDDRLLLDRRRKHVQRRRDIERGDRSGRGKKTHELTCLMTWMRQDPWDLGSRQCEVISAMKVAPPMPAASSPTRVRKASSCSGVNAGWVGLR